ncbi:MAG: N(5)-(carboxyethyl)ornithine synthase [Acidobacteriota bacterium]|nr:N(5)-(carboxyethyl)ornithine synthase [Acidobacteriota bacterium]
MRSEPLTMGVFGTSLKENEARLPIHPKHLNQIDPELRKRMFLEVGYGSRFGPAAPKPEGFAGFLERDQLFERCDILLLPKPCEGDYKRFQDHQILWGWPHCVQGPGITQAGIDRKMTYIAWEEMHQWRGNEDQAEWVVHTFHKNNELAGYCSAMHALQLQGYTGHYGIPRKAAVISFGSTAQGACYALQSMGVHDITVFKQRPAANLAYQIPTLNYRQFKPVEPRSRKVIAENDTGEAAPMIDVLSEYDIVINCILQDTDRPLDFVYGDDEIARMKTGALIIDVSCDTGMGFSFAKPTGFENPMFTVNDHLTCYAVDHSPSFLWNSATHEISTALLPYLPIIMAGPEAWRQNLTIARSIEIMDGRIQNKKILSFQKREESYPHAVIG